MIPASNLKQVPLTPVQPSEAPSASNISTSSLHRTKHSSLHVWEYAPGQFEWHANDDQSACVLSGSAEVHLSDGRTVRLEPGTTLFVPGGQTTRWFVESTLRTIALHHATS